MKTSRLRKAPPQGFALVVAITLMVLLTLIAVGFLSLSSVTLRTSSAMEAASVARANARMAMVQAIAQLQSLTGPDTRITATADLLDEKNPPVTGVWRSWEGLDRDSNGKPIPPDYSLKKRPGDATKQPTASGANEGRFLGWLTSAPQSSGGPDLPNTISTQARQTSVPMVADGSVRDNKRRIYIEPTLINQGKGGAFAWWTSGENSKAMAQTEPADAPQSAVEWQERIRANGRADLKDFGLEKINSLPKTTSIPSRNTLDLLASNSSRGGLFHDVTTYSRGLQVNVAAGGWKKDLSLFIERFSSYPSSSLPTYQAKPGDDPVLSAKASSSTPNNTELLYPKSWGAAYRNNGTGAPWQQVPPICSWSALADWATQYTRLSTSSASKTGMPIARASHGASSERFEFQDQVRRTPQIARIHWIYSLGSVKVTGSNAPKYKPGLLITPALTLWNPYNVELNVSNFSISIQQTAPLRFTFDIGGTQYISSLFEITRGLNDSSQSDFSQTGAGYQGFVLNVGQSFTLAPGACRVFGVADTSPRSETLGGVKTLQLVPGYRPNGGILFHGINRGQEVSADGSAPFKITKIDYDAATIEGNTDGSKKSGIGILYDISVDSKGCSAHRMIYDQNEIGGDTVLNKLYPPMDTSKFPSSYTVQQVEGLGNRPFASAVFAYRMASPASTDRIRHKHLFSKGMLQANPLCYYTEIGFGDDKNAITSMQGTGVYHPVNAPYDFAFQEVDGWNDTMRIPQRDPATNSGYIVSGLTSGEGVTRCVMAELPTRPIQSLAELQHFDARNNNPIPPFQFNLIGNGSANPIFGPDQLSVSTSYNNGLCNDDTFLLNHVLFDDWFASSVAQDLKDFSRSQNRSVNQVIEDFLSGSTPLPNRLYQPSSSISSTEAKDLASTWIKASKDSKTSLFPYESLASKLEVVGMFNVNSVSLAAWKAFLKHGRGAKVPYLNAGGATDLDSGSNDKHPYPRSSIAGDQAADSGSGESNAGFPDAAQYAGYQAFTDDQIDALAAEIVKEIRNRGPFLSLGEFINRGLTTDKDLAIASVIQKALDTLSASGNSPFAALQRDPAVQITSQPAGQTDYKFPEAALGWSSFGMPGWTRQADLLKPLAPLITVRDDTFVIRAYGDARDRANPQKIISRAWCEVVLQRKADYVDPADDAAIRPWSSKMQSETNRRFGRKYQLISFRWLNEKEV